MASTFINFFSDTYNEPWSKGMVVILMNLFYLFAIIVAVKILRKDSQHRE